MSRFSAEFLVPDPADYQLDAPQRLLATVLAASCDMSDMATVTNDYVSQVGKQLGESMGLVASQFYADECGYGSTVLDAAMMMRDVASGKADLPPAIITCANQLLKSPRA